MVDQKNFSEDLLKTLNVLSDKLGVKADELFNVLLKQTQIELYLNILYAVLYIIMFILGVNGFLYVKPFWMSEISLPISTQFSIGFISFGSLIFSVVPLMSIISTIREIIILKFNPKYWILKDLLKSTRSNY